MPNKNRADKFIIEKRVKHEQRKWNYIITIMIAITGVIYYYINQQRIVNGYFTSTDWIFLDNFVYIIFFGLLSGFVLSFLLNKTSVNQKIE